MSAATARSLPVFFTAHGSPMNALGRSAFARSLAEWGRQWPACRALLLVSAHWRAPQARLTGAARPDTVHDFFGFPEELYELSYPAPGDPELARHVAGLLSRAGFDAAVDERGGESAAARDAQVAYLVEGAYQEFARREDPNAATFASLPTRRLDMQAAPTSVAAGGAPSPYSTYQGMVVETMAPLNAQLPTAQGDEGEQSTEEGE